jgi:signal transduction histidine kinase
MRYAIERHRFQQERRAALEWKKELDHLREVDRLRTLFMNTTTTPAGGSVPSSYGASALNEDDDRVKTPEEYLTEIIDQLVGIVQIQEGTATLRRESADLNQMVRELVDSAQGFADRQRVGLDAYAQGPLFVELDPLRVIQTVRALLDHALRYTTPGGRVLVETETKDGHAIVRVRDTGAGMSPEDVDQVFRIARSREAGGVVPRGLSMFLAKQLVELHGGQIWAHSDGPGHGSTVSFSLPLRPA